MAEKLRWLVDWATFASRCSLRGMDSRCHKGLLVFESRAACCEGLAKEGIWEGSSIVDDSNNKEGGNDD